MSNTKNDLTVAVEGVFAEAMRAWARCALSSGPEDIKVATTELEDLLRFMESTVKPARVGIASMLEQVRARCKHPGAQRGHNERDGSWMNRCPTCGATE